MNARPTLEIYFRADLAIARLRNTMDKASLEAQERGLTPEILESILNNDE